jgi:hypothetical protein
MPNAVLITIKTYQAHRAETMVEHLHGDNLPKAHRADIINFIMRCKPAVCNLLPYPGQARTLFYT